MIFLFTFKEFLHIFYIVVWCFKWFVHFSASRRKNVSMKGTKVLKIASQFIHTDKKTHTHIHTESSHNFFMLHYNEKKSAPTKFKQTNEKEIRFICVWICVFLDTMQYATCFQTYINVSVIKSLGNLQTFHTIWNSKSRLKFTLMEITLLMDFFTNLIWFSIFILLFFGKGVQITTACMHETNANKITIACK